jgi:hypothetical protein
MTVHQSRSSSSAKIFASVSSYVLGRIHGVEKGTEVFLRQLEAPGPTSLPAVRTVARLRQLAEVELRLDTGATCIGKARSRAFHAAHTSDAEAWVSCDDDVEATTQTLAWMLEAVEGPKARICVVPCALRGRESEDERQLRVNVELPRIELVRNLSTDRSGNVGRVHAIERAGLGLFALNRAAMNALVAEFQDLVFHDDDGQRRLALFHDVLSGGRWYGEDLSFFERVRAVKDILVEALVTGVSSHGANYLDLSLLPYSSAAARGLV